MTANSAEPAPTGRRAELATALAAVRARIERAGAAAGRDGALLTLVVVTKTYPVSDVRLLGDLGVRDVGESRHQEAAAKQAELTGQGFVWHFIGALQSNKARAVARYADLVHSVDRSSVVAPLARGAQDTGRPVGCLIQVSLDDDPTRAGAPIRDVARLADLIAGTEGLLLRGVMAVAPQPGPGAVGDVAHDAFTLLADVHRRLRADHPQADVMSAGMSGDLESAVACGATHLRVGSAILGRRPMLG